MGTWCLPGMALIHRRGGRAAIPGKSIAPGARFFAFAVELGNASYCVYLFHAAVITYLLMADRHGWSILSGGDGSWLLLFVAATGGGDGA